MNTTFKTSIAAAAAIFALSGIAHADGVKISLIGKSAKTIHAEIVQAAAKVCNDTGVDSILLNSQAECRADTIAKTEETIRLGGLTQMAKADTAGAQHGER